jgi:hypothetical protein
MKGQMIIEAMIAFAVTMVALVALLELSNRSVSNSGLANRNAVATAYTDEGINWVRQQHDGMSWASFFGLSSVMGIIYCLPSANIPPFDPPTWPAPGACGGGDEIPGTIYTRELVMTNGTKTDNEGLPQTYVQANIKITWSESSRTVIIQRQSDFFENVKNEL